MPSQPSKAKRTKLGSKKQTPKSQANRAQTTSSAPIASSRKIRKPVYKSFRLSKRIRASRPALPSSWRLFKQSLMQLKRHWRLFGGLIVIYLVLNILLVKGFGVSGDAKLLKEAFEEVFSGGEKLLTGLTVFSFFVQTANTAPSEVAGAYQSALMIVMSLVAIWSLRQTQGNEKRISVRTALYNSTYPLIPFVIVLFVLLLQMIPILIAGFMYSIAVVGGLAVTGLEIGLWFILIGLLLVLSIYMLVNSIFAMYVVTLPNLTPLTALRSARQHVMHRRLVILVKILFLFLMLLVIGILLVVPVILVSPIAAEWLFYVMSVVGFFVVHSYMYNLYRELIRE